MVLAGFADRLAHRRTGRTDDRGRPITVFQLRHGGEVEATDRSGHLAGHEWVVVVDLDARAGSGRPGRLHLGSGLQPDAVAELLANHVREHRSASFDPSTGRVVGTVRRMLDDITVESRTWRRPDRGAVVAAVADAIARHGPAVLARWNEADTLRARVRFLAAHEQSGAGESERSGQTRPGASSTGTTWPDMGEAHLGATAADWLTPTGSDPALLDVRAALEARLDWQQRRALDVDAPVSWTAPDGRAFRLRYGELPGEPDKVVLSAQLQDLLGLDLHPTVGTRRVPVTVEILSPARRPVQRTEDLPGFWRGSYAQVRAELRARYRKHPWPERPWEAARPDRRLRGS